MRNCLLPFDCAKMQQVGFFAFLVGVFLLRVLSHGVPFATGYRALSRYHGEHDIRSLGGEEEAPPFHRFHHRYDYERGRDCFPAILARMRPWLPEIILCWNPSITPPPENIEEVKCFTVAVVSDWELHYPALEKNLGRYDAVVCDRPGVDVLNALRVKAHYLQPVFSFVSGLSHEGPAKKDIDVLYLATETFAAEQSRAPYLAVLARLSERYSIHICHGFEQKLLTDSIQRARIVVGHSSRGELHRSLFETMAGGVFTMLNEQNVEAGLWFRDGQELVLYNANNFSERIEYYLEHAKEAQEIAERGNSRVQAFAGENCLDDFIAWAASQSAGGRPFREFSSKERRYQSLLQYGCSWSSSLQEREREEMNALLSAHPEEACSWTLMARFLCNPHRGNQDWDLLRGRCIEALQHARDLEPSSAVHAMNLAWAYRFFGLPEEEREALRAVLACNSLDMPELLLGQASEAFYAAWQRALWTREASLDRLHLEARLRLAAYALASDDCGLALAVLPEEPELAYGRGRWKKLHARCMWLMGAHEDAIQELRSATELLPFDLDARGLLAEWYGSLMMTISANELHEEIQRLKIMCDESMIAERRRGKGIKG
jgi:hypothetical protein